MMLLPSLSCQPPIRSGIQFKIQCHEGFLSMGPVHCSFLLTPSFGTFSDITLLPLCSHLLLLLIALHWFHIWPRLLRPKKSWAPIWSCFMFSNFIEITHLQITSFSSYLAWAFHMIDFGDSKNVSDGQGRALGWGADDLDSPLNFTTYLSDQGQIHLPRQPGFVVIYISRICSESNNVHKTTQMYMKNAFAIFHTSALNHGWLSL